ncbi:MAG: FtsH protease activity modulator HflK [Lachnospiraceae bacterium]|nr:FtsH protease activity modulator HflK [Cuneatibacter sp.]MDD6456021.1 FtsH protease activity modulator HflK [Lachnospiraceae bacterium]
MKEKTKKIVKTIAPIVLILLAVLILGMGCWYTIGEQEQAVLTTLGKAEAITSPGLHFKIPLIQNVEKVNSEIHGMEIGYSDANGEMETEEKESLMITSDYNFVNVDFYVEYRVADPVQYVYASEDPEEILRNIAQSCIRNTIGSFTVDDVLTTGKQAIQSDIRQEVIDALEVHQVGLQLVNLTIQDAEPPTNDVMVAFKAVETAKQGMETAINNANRYRNEQTPQAEAEADRIRQEAEATRTERINEANAAVALFNAQYEEYVKNPEITKLRMFYESMEKVLPDLKVVIDAGDGTTQTILPLDTFTGNSSSTSGTDSNNSAQQTETSADAE